MKKFLSLIVLALLFSSCQEDVKFNTPGFQGLKDDVFWRANDARAYISTNGTLSIQGLTQFEELDLNTSGTVEGTYLLGTTNNNNKAIYTSTLNDIDLFYETLAVPGPAFGVYMLSGGLGYSDGTSVATTTTGAGSGLTVNIKTNPDTATGAVTKILIVSGGNGYVSGDLITVAGGNGGCRFRVANGGEIVITEYDNINQTVSGTFKFNAMNTTNNPAGGPILNFQYGAFYKVQIYPEL